MTRPNPRPRSLAPREHGAYGQLGLPLLTALAMGRPGPASFAIATGAALAFAAHEPLLVLVGLRGARARREERARAARRLAVLGGAAALAGGAGLALAPSPARLAALVPVGLSMLIAPFIARSAERSAPGELLAAGALASAALPVALAAGVDPRAAFGAWTAFFVAFGASTFSVRTVIAHARSPIGGVRRVLAPACLAVLTVGLVRGGVLALSGALGAVPMLALAMVLALTPPRPTSLRRVGWALVVSSTALFVAIGVGAHL